MSFLKTMDLYQGIILLSIILLPAGGWWVNNLSNDIADCERALHDATKPNGFLEEIGELQKKIEIVAANRRTTSDAIQDPSTYFEGQIMSVSTDLKKNDFTPGSPKPARATIGKQKVVDYVVDIGWGRGKAKQVVKMDFIYAVLFNCESGAKRGMANGPPSVWRLRKLTIANALGSEWLKRKNTPDPEMEDKWFINDMKFARREPVAKK